MSIEFIRPTLSQDRRIAPRLRIIQHHRLLKQLEAIHLLNGASRCLDTVEDDKRLPLGLQVLLGDYLDDVAIFLEDLLQSFLQLVDLDAFFEVADLDYSRIRAVSRLDLRPTQVKGPSMTTSTTTTSWCARPDVGKGFHEHRHWKMGTSRQQSGL